jgi:diamine N-acetyltransferase
MRDATPAEIARDPDPFAEPISLPSGERLVFRPLKQEDSSLLADYFVGLSAETRRRFGPHPFTAEQAAILCAQIDYGKVIRLLAVTDNAQKPQAVAYFILGLELNALDGERYRARGMELDRASACSIAPSVADHWQGRGLGTMVMARTLALASGLGRKKALLQGGVQATNLRAIQFYEKFGFCMAGSFSTTVENHDMVLDLTLGETIRDSK